MDTSDPKDPLLPPALLAQMEAAAMREHRPAQEMLREAVEHYLQSRRPDTEPAKRTPREAAARMLERRPSHVLPDGMSIRDMMTDGRA